MNAARYEWRVGAFVLAGLVLLGILMAQFSKGWTFITPTYELILRSVNAGVPIGSVVSTDLSPDGKSVIILLKILKQYSIHRDAEFTIEQSGFLGDQFIAITPQENKEPLLQVGDEVSCLPPFNMQSAAREAVQLMHKIDKAAQTLDTVMKRVDRVLLSEQTLTNATETIANLRRFSGQANTTVDRLDAIVGANQTNVTLTISNLTVLSERMNRLARDVQDLVDTNRSGVTAIVQNIRTASDQLRQLLADLQAGKGMAGGLLQDERLHLEFRELTGNLTLLSSNLNKYGLLYKPRPVKPRRSSLPFPGKVPGQ
jgi:phospholipid/cholesterol/gamma-HCH transport system substrate-binding protein